MLRDRFAIRLGWPSRDSGWVVLMDEVISADVGVTKRFLASWLLTTKKGKAFVLLCWHAELLSDLGSLHLINAFP